MQNTPHKIHIVGSSGSGKTFLSQELARKLSIPLYELDNIHWVNDGAQKSTERNEASRDALLSRILAQKSWIIEGVYYKWLADSFAQADIIIILNAPTFLRSYRILKRYLFSKLGLTTSNDPTLKAAWENVMWGINYSKNKLPVVLEMTEKYENKRFILSSKDDVRRFLKSL